MKKRRAPVSETVIRARALKNAGGLEAQRPCDRVDYN